jgi:hypothetical protein
MEAQDIITKFEVYVDDATELSSQQELDLLNKVYQKVCTDTDWEFLKKNATGTFTLNVPNIPLPNDFGHFAENNQNTDNTQEINNNAAARVIFIGSAYQPFQIINWSDRRQYRNLTGSAYLDLPNNGITFTLQPTATDTYDYDYVAVAPDLDLDDEPLMPERFQHALYHLMAIDDEMILHFPRANAYAPDNADAAQEILADMSRWNAELQNN